VNTVDDHGDEVELAGLLEPDPVDDFRLTTVELADHAGITYRQLNYWCRKGWLDPIGGQGTGNKAAWPLSEAFVAVRMATLVNIGMSPAMAARMARAAVPM
jgi:hypothetical protein